MQRGEIRIACKILVGEYQGKRLAGRNNKLGYGTVKVAVARFTVVWDVVP